MKRIVVFVYGVVSYAVFFATFLYLVGFMGNLVVPKSIDSPRAGSFATALAIDLVLVAIFAVQHSVMARPAFKRWWTRFVPEPAERSTYVLASSVALMVLMWQWRPLGGALWAVSGATAQTAAYGLYLGGVALVLVSTFLIHHFDLFGLRQVWLHLRGYEYRPLAFRTPGPYRIVRHPLYVGWMLSFWATPVMTVTHLVFATAMTVYILVAIRLEERDLIAAHPEYSFYRQQVPMFVPALGRRLGARGELLGDPAMV